MPPPDSPWLRHHRQRWLRQDAHLWIRPDAARFFPPGTDPADIDPTLPRKPDAANANAFQAEVEAGYRLLAVLREEVDSLRAELKRRRALEAKYSPSQPRVPAGNPRGGQWTDRSGDQSTSLAQPMGNVDVGDVSGSSELGDLFQIGPDGARADGVQLAANDSPTIRHRSATPHRKFRSIVPRPAPSAPAIYVRRRIGSHETQVLREISTPAP